MAPEKAKLFIVDDDADTRDIIGDYMQMAGHKVVAEAGSVAAALTVIAKLRDVDVALVDGNLSPHSRDGQDGAEVAAAFRQKFPGKPVFSISADRQLWSDDPDLSARDGVEEILKRVNEA